MCVERHMEQGLRERAMRLAGEVVVGNQPGKVIRSAREHHNFTQTWLAPKLDLRRESLSRIESGRSSPTIGVVDRFARVITLARHVREATARSEKSREEMDPARFEAAGRPLGLTPAQVREIAAEAIAGYEAKREQLLEGVDTEPEGGPPA